MGAAGRLSAAVLLACASAIRIQSPPDFWPRHVGNRDVFVLDGTWQFGIHLDPRFDSMGPIDPSLESWTPNTTSVPSSFDVAPPGIMGPRGVAMYRTRFRVSGSFRLYFAACSFYCRVFVDNKEIGDHRAGGYVPFFLDNRHVSGRLQDDDEHELFVIADNRFNRTTAPLHTGGDFWMYGGIVRSVVVHQLPVEAHPWVWRASVIPCDVAKGLVNLTVALTSAQHSGPMALTVQFDNGEALQLKAAASKGTVFLPMLSVPSPRPWSPSSPALHNVTVTTDDGIGIVERFGLRIFGVDSATGRVTINGEVVKLMGWNHHTQWPGTGASPTRAQLSGDLDLLKKAGANYVRGCHYPQDQRWLDMLDESGMVMWEETLGPNVGVGDTTDFEVFMPLQLKQLEQMIRASVNHASIFAWAWFNEGPSDDPRACAGYDACAEKARALDPSRFQTYATNKGWGDQCLANVSLIAFNSYPAWYGAAGDLSAPNKTWTEFANGVREKYPRKPFVISETGAGGVYEWSQNKTDARWTLKYQTEIVSRDAEVALYNGNISGVTLWHLFDFKGDDRATTQCGQCDYLPGVEPPICGYINVSCWRPGGVNHKGAVDMWRRKKPTYDVVAQLFRNFSASSSGAALLD